MRRGIPLIFALPTSARVIHQDRPAALAGIFSACVLPNVRGTCSQGPASPAVPANLAELFTGVRERVNAIDDSIPEVKSLPGPGENSKEGQMQGVLHQRCADRPGRRYLG